MILGGPVFRGFDDPDAFAAEHVKKGYRAAIVPGDLKTGDSEKIRAYKDAFAKHGIVPAEVGAWCNPLTKDTKEAEKNINYIIERLALADEIEARTCVNIIGSWHPSHWYGPDATNFGKDFFDHAVDVYRKIIDMVKPARTKMSFEIMPYCFLDGAAEYVRFMKAVDRKEAAIHFDPANCINCPRLLYDNADFLKSELALLKGNIASIHLKDLTLHPEPPAVHLEEVPIGMGFMDYVSLLTILNDLPADTPAMLEHLPNEETYDMAAANVRRFAKEAHVSV